MNNYFVNDVYLLQAADTTMSEAVVTTTSVDDAPATGLNSILGQGNNSMFLMIGGLFLIMYFFMIRPQSKRQKEAQNMLKALEKGDKVMSAGGITGTVDSVKETTFIVKVDTNTKIEFAKSSITTVVEKKNPVTVEPKKGLFGFGKNKNDGPQTPDVK